MSQHNVIVVSGDPKGHFIEGVMVDAAGAFQPGQIAMIDPTAEMIDGRPQYKLWDGTASGAKSSIVVIRENALLGGTVDTEYAAGSRFFGYIPVAGDEVQVLLADQGTATGAVPELGEKLIVEDGTGKVVPTTGTPGSEPFEAMEVLSEPMGGDALLLARATGV